jgi:predicted enzyme related to lactoylglutathione lyase
MHVPFEGGVNIAMKIPLYKYQATVEFYRDILKLPVEEKPISHPTVSRTHQVKFGGNIVWLDCVDNYTHPEIWLELKTPDVPQATDYLKQNGVGTCDEIEKIPEEMHWIMDPAGSVFILSQRAE